MILFDILLFMHEQLKLKLYKFKCLRRALDIFISLQQLQMKGQARQQQFKKSIKSNHAFNKMPTVTQIITYFIIISELAIFSACIQSNISNKTNRIILLIFFYFTFITLLVAWFYTSYTDASDAKICRSSNFGTKQLGKVYTLYCSYCKSLVSDNSRHCKICDTCIQQFDHHCIWINNCVGKYNYTSFIWMILSVLFNFLSFIVSVALVWQENKWRDFMIEMIASWISFVIVLIFFVLVFSLTMFHLYLIYQGKTTYQHFTCSKNKVFPEKDNKIQLKNRQRQQSEVYINFNVNKQNNELRHNINDCQHIQSIKIQVQFEGNKDHTEKSSSICDYQKKQKEGKNVIFQKNSQCSSYAEYQNFRRNKSYDYVFGRLDLTTSPRISRQISDAQKRIENIGSIQNSYKTVNTQNKIIKKKIKHRK